MPGSHIPRINLQRPRPAVEERKPPPHWSRLTARCNHPARVQTRDSRQVTRYLTAGIDICRNLQRLFDRFVSELLWLSSVLPCCVTFVSRRGQRSRIGFLRQRFIGIRQISGQFRDGAVRSSQVVAQLCDGIGQILHRCRISLLATAALVVASPFSSWVVRLPVEVSRLPCCVTVVVRGVNRRRRGIRSILNLLRRCHISHMPVRNEPYGAIRAVLRSAGTGGYNPVHHRLRDLKRRWFSAGRGGDFPPRREWRTGARIWPNGGANIQIKIRRAGAAGNQCADLNHIVKRGRERGKVRW